jgi:hypothetical protein
MFLIDFLLTSLSFFSTFTKALAWGADVGEFKPERFIDTESRKLSLAS